MPLSTTPTSLTFLTEPNAYTVRLPTDVKAGNPQFRSIVDYEGPREIVYVDTTEAADPNTDPNLTFQYSTTGSGYTVSVYRENEPPPELLAYWRLPSGFLQTWMEESQPDEPAPGRTGLDTVIANLGVWTQNGRPRITHYPPVAFGELRDPTLRDITSFVPSSTSAYPNAWPAVLFRHASLATSSAPGEAIRPVPDADEVVDDVRLDPVQADEAAEAVASTIYGVDVIVQGPPLQAPALRQLAVDIAQTLRPVDRATYFGDINLRVHFDPWGGLEGLAPTGPGTHVETGTWSGEGTGKCVMVNGATGQRTGPFDMAFSASGSWRARSCAERVELLGEISGHGGGTPGFTTSFRLRVGIGGNTMGELSLGSAPAVEQALCSWISSRGGLPEGWGNCEMNTGFRMRAAFKVIAALL